MLSEWLVSCVTPPGSSNKPVSLAVPIDDIVYVLVSLDYVTIVLIVIDNPGYVIVVFSSTADDKGDGTVVVVSAVFGGYGAVLSISFVDEVSGAVIVAITVTVFYWYPNVFIVFFCRRRRRFHIGKYI